jgi:hypothetical protein
VLGVLLRDLTARRARVRGVGLATDEEHLAHDEFVGLPAERIIANENGLEHAVGAIASRLFCAGTVEGPDGRLLTHGDDLTLGPQLLGRL